MDDFIHISTGPGPAPPAANGWSVSRDYFAKTQGERWFTEGQMVNSIRQSYPKHHLTVNAAWSCELLAFADSRDDTSYAPRSNHSDGLLERSFIPPLRRYNDETGGQFGERVVFGVFDYVFKGNSFLVLVVEGHDGMMGKNRFNYILVAPEQEGKEMSTQEKEEAQRKTDELVKEGTKWMQDLHGEVLVFDQGYWQKNRELWQNIRKA